MGDNNSESGREVEAKVVGEGENYHLVLPCDVKDFRDFVSGLLGKPEVLTGYLVGSFDIGYADIANIYHLVDQRVRKQNTGSLIHFAITVYYSSGQSITHNDVEKFKGYHPIEKCYPEEVVLDFTYLLEFPGKNVPEKQRIEVALCTDPHDSHRKWRVKRGATFEYRIEYTDRTWATDISGLLKNHGKSLLDEYGKSKRWLRVYADELIIHTGFLVLAVTVGFWGYFSIGYLESIRMESANTLDASIAASKYFVGSGSGLVILALITKSVRRYVGMFLHVMKRSFIVLVDADRKHREEGKRLEKRLWLKAAGAWIGNIAAGVVASYLAATGQFVP